MKSFLFAVLTARECAYEGEIVSLVLPTEDGLIGFLADREETVVEVVAGDLRLTDTDGITRVFETDGGVFRACKEGATLLCGAAYAKEEAAEKKQQHAQRMEEEKLKQEKSLADYKMTRAALMRAFEKLKSTKKKY